MHVNAAFTRLTGHNADKILGCSLLELLSLVKSDRQFSLAECVVSSSNGNNKKVGFLMKSNEDKKTLECRIKVAPIVARKTQAREVTNVTHFAIEVISGDDGVSRRLRNEDLGRKPLTVGLAVGVMG